MGRVYLLSVAVAGMVAFYVSATHQKDLQDRVWILTLDTAWLITGAIAFAAVRNDNIDVHRAVDRAQLRAYDRLCNRESVECLPDSRLLQRGTGMEPGSGDAVVYRSRFVLAQRFQKPQVATAQDLTKRDRKGRFV
jgi:hypothetical protein